MTTDKEPAWEAHWKEMPEFIQDDKGSVSHVAVHFETVEHREAFVELTGLVVTAKTKGVFFPPTPRKIRKVWVDES
jgi:hypothetical protein